MVSAYAEYRPSDPPPMWQAYENEIRDVRSRLADECLRRGRAAGRTAMCLHTTNLMTIARTMYERMGFVRVPDHDFYPVPSFHVMAYRLPLTPAR